jgi:probable RNA-binding protein EIF1AD
MHSRRRLRGAVLDGEPEPDESRFESIVRVIALRGSNVCEVQRPDGTATLAQIPTRFRKVVWIKRGNFVIAREPPGLQAKNRVRMLVEHVLFGPQVSHLKKQGLWPKEFAEVGEELPDGPPVPYSELAQDSSGSSSDGDGEGGDSVSAGKAEEDDGRRRRRVGGAQKSKNASSAIVMPSDKDDLFADNPNRRKFDWDSESSSSSSSSSGDDSSD